MLQCKDVTTLVGSDGMARASRLTQLRVRLHLLWCRHCQAYVRSIQQLGAMARRMATATPSTSAQDEAVIAAVRRAIVHADDTPGE